ncbi:alcohol acetyltransferase [Trichoderma arundinaceum]|uniref:Alcohol acetyltransferase n=1 Tax=Trichoderma arundinaceum TaxID=490622 RepID=A0A395NPT7_TRIAR|nr:alcohol acetyltransferase [Trichoderma arundinaceum]
MAGVRLLRKLRPLGKLEQVSASCHHLGFFNNVGLSAHYELLSSSSLAVSDLRNLVYAAVGDVVSRHRILFAIPVDEDTPNTYFASLPSVDLNRSIKFLTRSQPFNSLSGGEDKELDAILEDQHNTNFKADYGTVPFWRLIILRNAEANMGFTASFIYHHAIGDGVSGLLFHNAFLNALESASLSSSSSPQSREIIVPDEHAKVLPALGELHPLPINPKSPIHSAANLNEWTGNYIQYPCKSRWISLHLSTETSKSFFHKCKQNELSVTSVLSSIIAMALFDILPPTTEALTCIIPVNLRPWLQLPGKVANTAIGTYFDATRVQFTRPSQSPQAPSPTDDIWAGAQQASRGMRHYLDDVSPSGEPYTAVSVLEAIPDVSAIFSSTIGNPRDAAFEVTNVGLFSSALETKHAPLWQVGKVLLSRSSLVSGAAITVSAATGGDGSMTVGFSWQEGVLEDGLVQKLNQRVRQNVEDIQ